MMPVTIDLFYIVCMALEVMRKHMRLQFSGKMECVHMTFRLEMEFLLRFVIL